MTPASVWPTQTKAHHSSHGREIRRYRVVVGGDESGLVWVMKGVVASVISVYERTLTPKLPRRGPRFINARAFCGHRDPWLLLESVGEADLLVTGTRPR